MRSKVIFGLSAAKQGFATLRRLDMSNGVCVMICTYECESCLQSSRVEGVGTVDVGTLPGRVRRENLDIKNPNGYYGASRLYTNNHDRHCDATKDKATEKPNARRVGNGMEGASKTMGTLARNSFHHEWRAQKLEWVRGSNTSHGASGMRPRQVFERARVTAQ